MIVLIFSGQDEPENHEHWHEKFLDELQNIKENLHRIAELYAEEAQIYSEVVVDKKNSVDLTYLNDVTYGDDLDSDDSKESGSSYSESEGSCPLNKTINNKKPDARRQSINKESDILKASQASTTNNNNNAAKESQKPT